MTNKPTFTIIVPVYNAEEYIDECVNSIFSQSCSDYEAILVDDGSNDHSAEKIKSLIEGKPQFRLISAPHGGVCKARNTGLDCAQGEYICFLDSDDKLYPDYFETLSKAITQIRPDVVYFEAKYGMRTSNRKPVPEKWVEDLDANDIRLLCAGALYHCPELVQPGNRLCGINSFSSWGQSYRKDLLDNGNNRFVEGLTLSEDGLFNMRVLRQAKSGIAVKKQLYQYRIGNGSATRSFNSNLIEMFDHRNEEVKLSLLQIRSDEAAFFWEKYYCSLLYQLRIICEKFIFHPSNTITLEEKTRLLFRVIDQRDYANAIEKCAQYYLLPEDRIYLELAKRRDVKTIAKHAKGTKPSKIKRILRKIVRILHRK